jgi:mRNA-degrading endonuclease RelE of RelBE toxin-antitoxin system
MPWQIRRVEDFSKYLKKLGSDELNLFKQHVKDLTEENDPTRLGEFVPTRRHGRCWILRLNKSYRLAYRVDFNNNIILLVAVGDHKEIFGKD